MDYERIKATTADGAGKRYVMCDRDGRLYTVPRESPWLTVTIDKAGTTSKECDLKAGYKQLLVLIPTIDSATTTVHIAKEAAGTFYPLYALDDDATGDFASATTAATTAHAVVFDIYGARYIKIVVGAAQNTSERVFYVKGIN